MNRQPLLAIFILLMLSVDACAALVINATEFGDDTVFTAEGTLNLDGLSFFATGSATSFIMPANATVLLGTLPDEFVDTDFYVGITDAPAMFGAVSLSTPMFGTGDRFGFAASTTGEVRLLVPSGYSGGIISSTSTYTDGDFDSLRLFPGSYVWSWGSGANADSVTLNIGVVPEPNSVAVFAILGIPALLHRVRCRPKR